jgi:HK97 family phage major capsid protein
MPTDINVSTFQEFVLPNLLAKFKTNAEVEAEIAKSFNVLDDAGKPTRLKFVESKPSSTDAPKPAMSDAALADMIGAAVQKAVSTADRQRSLQPATEEEIAKAQTLRVAEERAAEDTRNAIDRDKKLWGFKSMADFYLQVGHACSEGGQPTDLLRGALAKCGGPTGPAEIVKGQIEKAASSTTTYGSESVLADGGYPIPPEAQTEIQSYWQGDDTIMAQTDVIGLTRSNTLQFPVTEFVPWGTGGPQAYWDDEAASGTETKIAGEPHTLRLKKLRVFVNQTMENLQDAPQLERQITQQAGMAIGWKIGEGIFTGKGAGKPLGFMQSGALVSVAKVTSQVAGTAVAQNFTDMYARLPAYMVKDSCWFVHPTVTSQMMNMTIGYQPMYILPGAFKDTPGTGYCLGLPVIVTQHCQTVGTVGDIVLFHGKSYKMVERQAGIQSYSTPFVYFVQDLQTFKFIVRVDGAPAYNKTISPANGSATMSPFLVCATRS